MKISQIIPTDYSGRPINRNAATIDGWHYQCLSLEITTTTGVFYCKDAWDNDKSSEFVITNSATETTVTWQPTYDYEIVSGNLKAGNPPSGICRLWAIGGALDLGQAGSKEFVTGGIRLDLINSDLKTDGRASKFMAYNTEGVPVPTNKFKFIFKHDANLTHTFNVLVEIFKQ